MIKFEKVSRFANVDFDMPSRQTENAAGYDMVVAEDITIPTWTSQLMAMTKPVEDIPVESINLEDLANLTKMTKARPTLVSTGVKCYLEPGYYLELSARSSTPLKYWLVVANGVGIIDADYADNKNNEGEIFFQVINFSPYPIALKKGDIIGQGIVKKYHLTDDDELTARATKRTGGFGSTSARQPAAAINEQIIFNQCSDAEIYNSTLPKSYIYNGELPTINLSTEIEKNGLKEALDSLHKSMYQQLGLSIT